MVTIVSRLETCIEFVEVLTFARAHLMFPGRETGTNVSCDQSGPDELLSDVARTNTRLRFTAFGFRGSEVRAVTFRCGGRKVQSCLKGCMGCSIVRRRREQVA